MSITVAEWAEFDLEKGIWQIPAERMKMSRPHVVLLPHQSNALLEEIYQLTGRGRFVFSGRDDAGKTVNEASIKKVIKGMGYDEMSISGAFFGSIRQ
jgi:integrase